MIKTKEGNTTIQGNLAEIFADMVLIIQGYVEALTKHGLKEEEAWEEFETAVEAAKKSEEELEEISSAKLDELIECMKELIDLSKKKGAIKHD